LATRSVGIDSSVIAGYVRGVVWMSASFPLDSVKL